MIDGLIELVDCHSRWRRCEDSQRLLASLFPIFHYHTNGENVISHRSGMLGWILHVDGAVAVVVEQQQRGKERGKRKQ
jgi:hypothetical protein